MTTASLTNILSLFTLGYRDVDAARELPLLSSAPTLKIFMENGRIFKTTGYKTGGTVWDQGVNTSETKSGWNDTLTLQDIDNEETFELNLKLLGQGFKMTDDQLETLQHNYSDLRKMVKKGAKKGTVLSYIDRTMRNVWNKGQLRFLHQLYKDMENYIINGSGTNWIGFASVVGASGPSSSFGTSALDLSSLGVATERPWYVKKSGGTGAIADYGITLTGTSTMGKADTLKFLTLAKNAQIQRGLTFTHAGVSPAGYFQWAAAFDAGLTENINADTVKAYNNKLRDILANPSKQGAYELSFDRPLQIQGTILYQSPYIATDSMYLFDINRLSIETYDYNNINEFKRSGVDKDRTTLFSIQAERIGASALGLGRGAVCEIRGMHQFVPDTPAAIMYVGYDEDVA